MAFDPEEDDVHNKHTVASFFFSFFFFKVVSTVALVWHCVGDVVDSKVPFLFFDFFDFNFFFFLNVFFSVPFVVFFASCLWHRKLLMYCFYNMTA